MTLVLEFTAFNVQSQDSDCNNDHLTIRDGDGTILLRKTCNFNFLPGQITSRTNSVLLEFKTCDFGTRPGWSIIWSAISQQTTDLPATATTTTTAERTIVHPTTGIFAKLFR